MPFAVGSLVRVREREWVVLSEPESDLLILRPLGGSDDDITGVLTSLEEVREATFALPSPADLGDESSCRLLRDAIRLGFRASAGPFRSFGRISVEPRPYQLVPLLMALRLNPVRILIADDVGIGKTVEASLIARELLDRGEAKRLAVLCPPHLAEQWQNELYKHFHIEAELVLSSTASSLERRCAIGESLFDKFPYVVISMEFIKSDKRKDEFLRSCPELVIVDEAHTCTTTNQSSGKRHQRHELLRGLAANENRHLILVTATPHSGNEGAFRSLIALLNPQLSHLPENLAGEHNEHHRRQLAKYFVQRRRADIRHFMNADTPFPEREELLPEPTYYLLAEYKRFFDKVLDYARESVSNSDTGKLTQRVKWWSALALLRALASSPAAAAATLRNRTSVADTETTSDADEIGKRVTFDLDDSDSDEQPDITPGSDIGEKASDAAANTKRLLAMAKEADSLKGDRDAKLLKLVDILNDLLKEGFSPIVFCRFIDTSDYLAEELRQRLPKNTDISSVTSVLPPTERQDRITELAKAKKKILICTDCLSEGVNLQRDFDAVVHYDLSWNPTRHEQREGRVDRYGQPKKRIRVMSYYGADNKIDGIVLDVLMRKHRAIKNSLGISVPVPIDTNQVMEAIFEGLLLKRNSSNQPNSTANAGQLSLFDVEEYIKPKKADLFKEWELVSEREKRSRTMFAQEGIKADEIATELSQIQSAIGANVDVRKFTIEAARALKAIVLEKDDVYSFDFRESPRGLTETLENKESFIARFDPVIAGAELYLNRTHPVVEGLANYLMNAALDRLIDAPAKRAGVIRTKSVDTRTTLLLMRARYHIITKKENEEYKLLAEDCLLAGFAGAPSNPQWIEQEQLEKLVIAQAQGNINPDQAKDFIAKVIQDFDKVEPGINSLVKTKGEEILASHNRVRTASLIRGVTYKIEPQLPVDILGIYVYLPLL